MPTPFRNRSFTRRPISSFECDAAARVDAEAPRANV